MADVAKLAGVSHQTVSRVINNSEKVAPETRKSVHAAMRMLDYRPNSLARALATGRSRTLGVVSFDTTLYGPASTLLGIERAAHDAHYFVINASVPSLNQSSILDAVDRLRVQGVEGMMVITPSVAAASAVMALPDDLPLVAVEAGFDEAVALVTVDQHAGAASITRHLLELGHTTVHHIAGPEDWIEAQQRVAGWRGTLDAAGAPVVPPFVGNWSAQSGYDLAPALLTHDDLTAVFVANDQMALGVLRFLHEQGLRIPQDISVVGFDDIPEAQFFTPPLTTVRQNFAEMGRRSVHMVLEQIESASRSVRRETVAPELIVRSSSGPPPRR